MKKISETKIILDACCGSRMFWFDKHNPNVLFIDKRSETVTAKDRDKIRTIEVDPDFEDNSFYMVVFDPPHLKTLGETSWMAKSMVNCRKTGSHSYTTDLSSVCAS